ncbi:MAG TPA: outer membrane protein assembly factor BamD [Bacteroidales bacterium]|nr:outer membrane protein assembly factor BamD [Bacteroidales bacterium]
MRYKVFIYILLLALVSSCGQYEKVLKSTDYQYKYKKAVEYYNDGDFIRAATILDQVYDVFRGTVKADTVAYYRAESYYHQNDYIMASHYFEELANTFPNSVYEEESSFMTGYCYYKLSPRPSLDQEYTFKAVNTLTLFLINHPSTTRVDEANRIILDMREKLVEKSFLNAKLYFDLGDYKSAIIALRNSLGDFPNTEHREELMFLILKSSYLLAEHSVESKKLERYQSTVDEYYSFIGEFPEGEYADEAKDIYKDSMKSLGQEVN